LFLYISHLITPSRCLLWNHSISLISFLSFLHLVRVFLYYSSSRWRRSRTRWVIVLWCCGVVLLVLWRSVVVVFIVVCCAMLSLLLFWMKS
jgi:hypothetical protein